MAEPAASSVLVSSRQYSDLSRLARRLRVSNAELVRHAVEVYALLRSEICQGAEVLIHHRNGSIDKVVGI